MSNLSRTEHTEHFMINHMGFTYFLFFFMGTPCNNIQLYIEYKNKLYKYVQYCTDLITCSKDRAYLVSRKGISY